MDPEMVQRPEVRVVRVWDKTARGKIEETWDFDLKNNKEGK